MRAENLEARVLKRIARKRVGGKEGRTSDLQLL